MMVIYLSAHLKSGYSMFESISHWGNIDTDFNYVIVRYHYWYDEDVKSTPSVEIQDVKQKFTR